MNPEVSEQEKQEVLGSVAKGETMMRASAKLTRKSLDVEVPVNMSAIEQLETALKQLKETPLDDPSYLEQVKQVEQQIETLKSDTIKGTFVPLKSVDLLLVQGWVTESALVGREHGFEFEVQLFIMAKAERCATAYLALRQRNDHTKRYFKSQEDITLLDDRTLRELCNTYAENFVLTEDERKNLYGAQRS